MKPCDHWREELANHVLGAPASAALAGHVEECAACSSALREWQAHMRGIDEGIRQLAASEPSAEVASRVMASVRSRSKPIAWVPQWKTAAAALAGLLILGASVTVVWRTREQRKQTEQVISAAAGISSWTSPTQDLLRSSYEAWRKSPPRLGEYFYELKTDGLKMEHPARRGKEKEDP